MPKIFISYRRADSQYVTDSIFDHMKKYFDEVFLDVGSIPFGVDYRTYLRDQIAAYDVILVIIGPDWRDIMLDRGQRADDFVRIEIENALTQANKLVIPILVKGMDDMPNFDGLPKSIQDLQFRNRAVIRRHPDLLGDCQRLAEGIKAYVASQGDNVGTSYMTSEKLMPKPFAWIKIPAGRVTLENLWDDGDTYIGKKGQSKAVDVSAFEIAKYPITNAQFAKFIEAGGYNNQTWWTESGWAQRETNGWTEPRYWGDKKWNGAEQPVVGVSWYEAIAFCLWLSDVSGEQIMLPTEQQWQRAAQGDDGRTYPWGNEFDKHRCNTDESGISKTTPVTQYAGKGDSPFGVVDISGNVWEWCLTEYFTGSVYINNSLPRVLRGGSWGSYAGVARAAFRSLDDPSYRDYGIGFRVVCRQPPAP